VCAKARDIRSILIRLRACLCKRFRVKTVMELDVYQLDKSNVIDVMGQDRLDIDRHSALFLKP